MPWGIFKDGAKFCVHKLTADGARGERVACHDTESAAEAQRAALYASEAGAQQEIAGVFHDVLAVQELRGSFPDVPIADGVDYAALIAGDADPVFLTLPIGMSNVKSGNNRYYDAEFVRELARQTLANRPVGLMGHLAPDERATAFPPEAVHWVGAAQIGETLWGKGYVPPGPIRDRIRRYKAQGKALATSIDAFAEGVWDERLGAHRMKADTLRLNQIDIAPADRAGIAQLAHVPILTAEMNGNAPDSSDVQREAVMDRLQIIQELTAADARLLPEPVRAAILETVQAPPEVAQMEALRQALGLDNRADVVSVVTEMRRESEQRGKDAVKARITELVADAEKGIAIVELRPLVASLVEARNPATVQEAETHFTEIVGSETVKAALQAHLKATMGPNQTGASPASAQTGSGKYFRIPQREAA